MAINGRGEHLYGDPIWTGGHDGTAVLSLRGRHKWNARIATALLTALIFECNHESACKSFRRVSEYLFLTNKTLPDT